MPIKMYVVISMNFVTYGVMIAKKLRLKSIVLTFRTASRTSEAFSVFHQSPWRQSAYPMPRECLVIDIGCAAGSSRIKLQTK